MTSLQTGRDSAERGGISLLERRPRLLFEEASRHVRLHLQEPPVRHRKRQLVPPRLAAQELPRRQVDQPHDAPRVGREGLLVREDANGLAARHVGGGDVFETGAVIVGKNHQGRQLVGCGDKGDRLRLAPGRVDVAQGDECRIPGRDLGYRERGDERPDELGILLVPLAMEEVMDELGPRAGRLHSFADLSPLFMPLVSVGEKPAEPLDAAGAILVGVPEAEPDAAAEATVGFPVENGRLPLGRRRAEHAHDAAPFPRLELDRTGGFIVRQEQGHRLRRQVDR